jgi:putative ABC transport system substrate-binding protein
MGFGESDAEGALWLSSFKRALQELGWLDGRNMLMDVRWSGSNTERERIFAKELVSLQPDVILAHGTPVTAALRRETQMIPIVFGAVADPVGEGFIESLSRPGRNITGFLFSEAGMGGKWLELLKEIRSLGVEPITEPVHNEVEIETVVTGLGHKPESGLVAIGDSFLVSHRKPIILAAAENKVPAVYFHAVFARDGGLLSYGPDNADIFRRAASYVDRILRGATPAELPVQVPIKFETVINLKTAKALGLTLPLTLQVAATEVIE